MNVGNNVIDRAINENRRQVGLRCSSAWAVLDDGLELPFRRRLENGVVINHRKVLFGLWKRVLQVQHTEPAHIHPKLQSPFLLCLSPVG